MNTRIRIGIFAIAVFLSSVFPNQLNAQDFSSYSEKENGESLDYCYIHHLIKKNVNELSFVVTNLYDSEITEMIPLIVLSGEKPDISDLSIKQVFTVKEATIVRDYLKYLRESSKSHPKGLHRYFKGPAGVVIHSRDNGVSYIIDFFCNSSYYASINFLSELNDWINAFDECFAYIEKSGPLGEIEYRK